MAFIKALRCFPAVSIADMKNFSRGSLTGSGASVGSGVGVSEVDSLSSESLVAEAEGLLTGVCSSSLHDRGGGHVCDCEPRPCGRSRAALLLRPRPRRGRPLLSLRELPATHEQALRELFCGRRQHTTPAYIVVEQCPCHPTIESPPGRCYVGEGVDGQRDAWPSGNFLPCARWTGI